MTAASRHSGLYDRDAEVTRSVAALAAAIDGTGGIVVVQGAAGIGKTRFLDELCARVPEGTLVLRARGGEQERELPFAVVRELLQPAAALTPTVFGGAAALASPLFDLDTAQRSDSDSTFAVMHGLYWLVANLSARQLVALVVDDAQWADDASVRWLAYLVPRIRDLPVLLTLTLRSGETQPGNAIATALAHADVTWIDLGALSREATSALVRDAYAGSVAPEPVFCTAVHEATRGNPLLTRTLAAALADAGVEPVAGSAGHVESVGVDRIGRIVLPRLHRLGSDAVALARVIALLGEGCALRDAAEVAQLVIATAEDAVDRLVGAQILRPDRSLGFTHPVVRATVLDELTFAARSTLHRRAAMQLRATAAGSEQVAHHLLHVEPAGDPQVADELREAARLASARGAPEAEIVYLERALREPVPADARAETLLDLGWAGFRVRHERTLEWFAEALAATDDADLWVGCWLALTNARILRLETGSPRSKSPRPPALTGDLALPFAALRMMEYGWTGGEPDAQPDRTPLPASQPAGVTPYERMWLASASFKALMDAEPAERVIDLAESALRDGRLLVETADSWPAGHAVWALIAAGSLERALTEVDAGVELAVRRGSPMAFEWFSSARAAVLLRLGRVAEAEADAWSSLREVDGHGWRVGLPMKLAVLVDALRERGDHATAERELTRHGLLDADPPVNPFGVLLLESRGRLRLAEGRSEEALADLETCGRYVARWNAASAVSGWRMAAAECLAGAGDQRRAVVIAEEQLAAARRFGSAALVGASLRSLGTAQGGAAGVATLEQAVATLAATHARLEHAHAVCDLGRLHRRNRSPREARDHLRNALDLATKLGALALAERAAHELRAAGGRPRQHVLTGVDALTATERRVATLAAEGLSNPQIAQTLFVSRKTVEKHLSSVFLKLGVSSRGDLATVLL